MKTSSKVVITILVITNLVTGYLFFDAFSSYKEYKSSYTSGKENYQTLSSKYDKLLDKYDNLKSKSEDTRSEDKKSEETETSKTSSTKKIQKDEQETTTYTETESGGDKYWINAPTMKRHNRTCRWYGNTKNGYFTNKKEGSACGICGG